MVGGEVGIGGLNSFHHIILVQRLRGDMVV